MLKNRLLNLGTKLSQSHYSGNQDNNVYGLQTNAMAILYNIKITQRFVEK